MATLYDITKEDIEEVVDALFEGIKSDSDSIERLNQIHESSAALAVAKNRQRKLVLLSKFRSILAELYIVPKEQKDREIINTAFKELMKKVSKRTFDLKTPEQLTLNFLNEDEAKMTKVESNEELIKKVANEKE